MLWKMTDLYFAINDPCILADLLLKLFYLLLCSGSLRGNNLKKNRGSVVVKLNVCFKIVYLDVFTCI